MSDDLVDEAESLRSDTALAHPVHNFQAVNMANLASALEKLQLGSAEIADDWIDQIIDEQQRPRKRLKQDLEELKLELEQKYLTPSKSFSTEWLNKLQQ